MIRFEEREGIAFFLEMGLSVFSPWRCRCVYMEVHNERDCLFDAVGLDDGSMVVKLHYYYYMHACSPGDYDMVLVMFQISGCIIPRPHL